MYVGAVLKNVRESKGFSLVEIQNRTGIKESQLCRIESGTRFPTDDQIIILAKLYSLNKVDLIIQRDSDKLLGTVKDLKYPDKALEVAKQKLISDGKYLETTDEKLPGTSIPLASRRYIGSKAKLVDWIFDLISKETKDVHTATDIFAGTGVVSKRMLDTFDFVNINDLLFSNNLIYEAFFADEEWSKKKIIEKIDEYNNLCASMISDNYFSENYGGKYFEYNLSKKIGYIRQDIEDSKAQLTQKEYAILLTTLIYNIDRHANTVGHFEAYIKKPINDTSLVFKMIDAQNYPNAHIYREDSNALVERLQSDLVYIDPPYNSRQYSRFYHVYETLVKWDKPVLSGVAMKPPVENMSRYCTTEAPEIFEDLVKKINAKYLVVSYNNTYNSKSGSSKNKITLEQIRDILNDKGTTKEFAKDYRFFNAGKTDLENHQELLFITKVK